MRFCLRGAMFTFYSNSLAISVEGAETRVEVGQVGEGARLGDELLVEDATEGDHGEARVLDLAQLHRLEVVLAEAERVEAEVAHHRPLLRRRRVRVEHKADGAARRPAVEEDVDVADEEEELQPALRRDLRAGQKSQLTART